jgi:hypothetical protein
MSSRLPKLIELAREEFSEKSFLLGNTTCKCDVNYHLLTSRLMDRLMQSIQNLDNKLNDLNANTGHLGENKQGRIQKVKRNSLLFML